jgi:hypothetical protein
MSSGSVTVRFDRGGSPFDGHLLVESLEEEGLTVDYEPPDEQRSLPLDLAGFIVNIVASSPGIAEVVNKAVDRWKAHRGKIRGMPTAGTVRIIYGPSGEVLREVDVAE